MTYLKQFIVAGTLIVVGDQAHAALRFCNETEHVQSVAIGYSGDRDWMSEGWWNIDPGECSTVVGGNLTKRYYYYRAEVNAGDFAGGTFNFCTTPEEFEIIGDTNCEQRGYDTEGFREIDTGETATDFTFTLTGDGTAPRSEDGPATDTPELGLSICNSTSEVQSVSIGYETDSGFLSEGWWNVEPDDCALVLAGELQQRYYYYRAEVNGGPFDGEGYMFCTTPEVYEIEGDTNCEARGYDSESFTEIDTGPTAVGHVEYITANGEAPPQTTPDAGPVGDAGLEICNDTADVQSVTIGYEGAEDWTSEGWWNIDPGACMVPALDGVNRRYIYYRAEIDGGDFYGESYFFCTTPEAFVIVGDTECEARGYDREDFAEVDTGGTTGTFTLTLVSPNEVDGGPVGDDRVGFPDEPKVPGDPTDTDADTDVAPDEDTAETDTPEQPSFDFGVPGEDDEAVATDTDTDTAPDFDFDTPDTPETDTPDTPEADTPDPDTSVPEDDAEPTPTRRGGTRGG
ncbi:DUF1036 domain-containing protein [Psychromarinibacter halotolerans]|uniref:DUF1036 domain-containing protein n=1 Tax=Psychromarinibacter halotolerans TaxID=1775175 RepID=A0ABV7GRI5_9RHOB|nr:DUF1036 domain-containing protein [Psychromarinibacter halotolerans]MDF0596645.1 DUF1036 domain-containing protein [Psychromarinibacter halotolerans]